MLMFGMVEIEVVWDGQEVLGQEVLGLPAIRSGGNIYPDVPLFHDHHFSMTARGPLDLASENGNLSFNPETLVQCT